MTEQSTVSESALEPAQLIALNAVSGVSRAAICQLASSRERWWPARGKLSAADARALGVSVKQLAAARIAVQDRDGFVARELDAAESRTVEIITILDASYPQPLRELALPPPVLYIRGSLRQRPSLSIVGARHASSYGRDVAAGLATGLTERGLTIVSGFARGIDAAAHRAAARAEGGSTLAILGCGLDIDYPRGRDRLRQEVAANGALVSEFPFGTAPLRQNFPVRNRLIAALGHGTLVVEATARSGSLITARLALELGREVYAVPGRIFDNRAHGPNTLIRDGAFLVQHPRDILETLPQQIHDQLRPEEKPNQKTATPRLPPEQAQIIELLPPGSEVGSDELARESGLGVEKVGALLLELEIGGWVRRRPGAVFARTDLW